MERFLLETELDVLAQKVSWSLIVLTKIDIIRSMVEANRPHEESYQKPGTSRRRYTLFAFARDHNISRGSAYQFSERVDLENITDLTPKDVETLLAYQDEIRTNGRHIKPGYGSVAKELGLSRSSVHSYAATLGINEKKPSLEDLDRIREHREKILKKRSAK